LSRSPTSRRRPASTTPARSSGGARAATEPPPTELPPHTRPLSILLVLLVCFVPAALSIAACGEDETGGPATKPGAETGGGEPDAGAAAEAPEVGDGRGGVALEEIGRFEAPLGVAEAPGEEALYVVEQGGRVLRLGPRGETSTFLDLSERITAGGEQGLLSLAFHPRFDENGRLYVNYTDTAGNTRVIELRSPDGGRVAEDSGRELLRIEQPFPNHNGGLLLFGPDDHLYIGTGDGGGAEDPERNAQDPDSLLGKLLRIDPDGRDSGRPYGIPPGNPYADGGGRPEIFAQGLRNPWRFSFDRERDAIAIADVGQSSFEEINLLPRRRAEGADFGWPALEGEQPLHADAEADGTVSPVHVYPTADGNCSVTGGYVVRDRRLESLYGRYLYGDFCAGELRSFSARPGKPAEDDRALGVTVPNLSSFGEDRRGRIYATSLDGKVVRLEPAG
jgi:glucose/arabinose dehydrogenase